MSIISLSVLFVLHVYLFQLGGGYLFGLPVGFVADSIGATIGATAAFILGRTVSLVYHGFVGLCVRLNRWMYFLLL